MGYFNLLWIIKLAIISYSIFKLYIPDRHSAAFHLTLIVLMVFVKPIICVLILMALVFYIYTYRSIGIYSERKIQVSMWSNVIWIIVCIIIPSELLYTDLYGNIVFPVRLLIYGVMVFSIWNVRISVFLHLIAPYFTIKEDTFRCKLAECYEIQEEGIIRRWRIREKRSCYISFEGDSERYKITLENFRKMRDNIGKEYVYKKCLCKYGGVILNGMKLV